MPYQVLARKWRPRQFSEMVGQEHVLRALINALEHDRLHHAYLFTGTRGVGKTTVARILAKSLNCERGVSAAPCGECGACREIDEGRFVDLIEVDAASRTKVEDTRELLENVQYAPTRGRYKVYLIDEVHMLSNHSFNALLKTLEEPPPHVKFLLATTDPQKLPVTILSRCLQFNLRRLAPDLIGAHLGEVLGREAIEAEPPALAELARAADGSMRDALSLLDQAIAYGGGTVREADVRAMLGTLDRARVAGLLEALAEGDGAQVVERLAALAEQAPDYPSVLAELLSLLHHLALLQAVPSAYTESMGDPELLRRLGARLSPEDVQLFYQIGLTGRRDLPLAPDPCSGLEMVLLRMLAFRPAPEGEMAAGGAASAAATGDGSAAAPDEGRTRRERARGSAPAASRTAAPPSASKPARASAPQFASEPVPERAHSARQDAAPPATVAASRPPAVADAGPAPASPQDPPPEAPDDWHALVRRLGLGGILKQMALNTALVSVQDALWQLALDPSCEGLYTRDREERLQAALAEHLGRDVRLRIEVQRPTGETPAARQQREARERQAKARESIENDSNVRALIDKFDATVSPESIRPSD